MKWLLATINSLSLAAIILLTAIELPVFHRNFYEMEYKKYNIPVQIKVDESDLMDVTEHLLGYMRGKKPDLTVTALVDGQVREFFNEKEKLHMVDVRQLFETGFLIRNVAVAVYFLTIFLLAVLKTRMMDTLTFSYQVFLGTILMISGALVILIASNFDRAFTVFHEIFFTNDLWQLDPSTDLLVNIVPLGFFMDIALVIGVLFAVLSLLVMIMASLLRANMRYPVERES